MVTILLGLVTCDDVEVLGLVHMEQDKERLPRKDQSSYPDNMRRKKRKETKEKKTVNIER